VTIVQQGQINTTALSVPDLYVQIVPPTENDINGVPTNILGIVGTAQWGPVGTPVTIGDLTQQVRRFGNIQARKYDLGTAVWAAILQGANNIRAVRVSDGTDAAATGTVGTTGLTLTGKYTGSLGNSVTWSIASGTKTGTWKVVLAIPGIPPEVFDNLASGLTANAVWVAIASAINSGASALRGPSSLVVATAGASTTAPTASNGTLSGGSDGTGTITGAVLTGSDTTPRKGMYALRGTGALVVNLADCDDSTTWTTMASFALSENVPYPVTASPAGDTISNFASTMASAGTDTYALKVLVGDWCLFNDTVNGTQRLISPASFAAGVLANLSPEQSSLNKPMFGILSTQRSASGTPYSSAELQQIAAARGDVITNPIPAGNSFGCRLGVNASSNGAINGDNYTRLTAYIANTLNTAMGLYIGKLQSNAVRAQALGAVTTFLSNLQQQGMIGDVANPTKQAFAVKLDNQNNTPSRVAQGYMQIDVRITYLSVITKLLVNVEGGQTVHITAAPAV
jgi:ribosomal protein L21E